MVGWMMGWRGNKQERYWAEALNDDKDLRSYILYNICTLYIYIYTYSSIYTSLYIHSIYTAYIYTHSSGGIECITSGHEFSRPTFLRWCSAQSRVGLKVKMLRS